MLVFKTQATTQVASKGEVCTARPLAISAQPLSVICALLLVSKLVKCLFTCKISIKKAWLAGAAKRAAANQAQNTCNVQMKDWQTTWMSVVVS